MSSFGQLLLLIWCWVSCGSSAASPEASSPLASFGVCQPVLQGLVCPLQSPRDQDKPGSCSLLSVSLNNAHVNCRLTLGCVVSCPSHRACPLPTISAVGPAEVCSGHSALSRHVLQAPGDLHRCFPQLCRVAWRLLAHQHVGVPFTRALRTPKLLQNSEVASRSSESDPGFFAKPLFLAAPLAAGFMSFPL